MYLNANKLPSVNMYICMYRASQYMITANLKRVIMFSEQSSRCKEDKNGKGREDFGRGERKIGKRDIPEVSQRPGVRVFGNLNRGNSDINTNGRKLKHLRFANDTVVILDNVKDLRNRLMLWKFEEMQ